MDNDIPANNYRKKRPSFHLESESSSSEDEDDRRATSQQKRSIPTTIGSGPVDEAILRFSTESLHSFSYASVSQNSISQRISVLKKSLEFLRENPLMLKDLQRSLSSVSLASTAEAFSQRSGVLQHVLSNIRSSASSATLSMLNSISQQSPAPHPACGPGINRTAHYQQQQSRPNIGRSVSSDHRTETPNPFNENLQRVLETLESAYSSKDRAEILFSTPGLQTRNLPKQPQQQPQHVRALTNHSAMNIESQILESLATPYIDVAWQSMMQRSGSVSNVPAIVHSVSSLSLASSESYATPTITPLSTVASKYASKHSIFTTKDCQPFKILSSNDIACLVFGMSQSEMRSKSILDIIRSDERQYVIESVQQARSRTVPVCGALFPIVKSNGHENVASFWVKYNAKGFLIWVVEEVLQDKAILKMNGNIIEKITEGINHESLIPSNTKDITQIAPKIDLSNQKSPQYLTLLYNSQQLPAYARVLEQQQVVEITSLPHMAGVIILNKNDLKIIDYNKLFLTNLFGYQHSIVGESIDLLIPDFSNYLSVIVDVHQLDGAFENIGLVIPEHMFRKTAAMTNDDIPRTRTATTPLPSVTNLHAEWKLPNAPGPNSDQQVLDRYAKFVSSTGIEAKNVNGEAITVDIQLRVVSPSYFALWVTYSRNVKEFRAQSEVPSQLKLFYELQQCATSNGAGSADHSRNSSASQTSGGSLSAADTSSSSAEQPAVTTDGVSVDLVEYAKHTPEIGAKRRIKRIDEDFEIILKMGEGAYGKVLLAQYIQEPRITVVVKCVIKERILVDTWTRDRKLGTIPNEIKVMATLNNFPHENIIRLLDFFEDDDYYHIEMERHGNPSTDLFDLIELKPNMEESECKSIFKQVVKAVAHLHHHGIVHRDIKDENVVVDDACRVKLIDFGSSAFIKQGPFDVFVGTIDYAAPEVLGGRPYIGKPQDIWALGILLYTIVYKENPFYNVDEIMDGDLRIPYVTSQACLDLVNLILCRDVDKRPDIDTILHHEWLN